MFRALDGVVRHQTLREVDLLMRAQAVGIKIMVIGRLVDGKGLAVMIETDDVCPCHFVNAAQHAPIGHLGPP